MTFPTIRDVLDEWFLPLDDPAHGHKRELWWKSTPEFDAAIAARFGALVDRAIAGELDHWRRSPDGALALIVLFGRTGIVTQFLWTAFDIPRSRWIYGLPGVLLAQVLAMAPIAFVLLEGAVRAIIAMLKDDYPQLLAVLSALSETA